MGPSMTFHIGERVVYPNQGVGTIENISTRSFGSQMERFYLLRLVSNGMTIMIPFSHVSDVGLRKVTRGTEINRMLEYLARPQARRCQDWKDRYKENSEKMRVGGMLEVAEVMKCLLVQQGSKPLSFREKKMLERARQMMITEVSAARGTKADEAETILSKALSKAGLSLPEPL
jgi:CarD family transcriptional regulator